MGFTFTRKKKIFLEILIVIIVIFVAAYTFWYNIKPRSGAPEPSYIGLTLNTAKKKAAKEGLTTVRVVNDQHGIQTMEYNYHRLNVHTLFNIVIKASKY